MQVNSQGPPLSFWQTKPGTFSKVALVATPVFLVLGALVLAGVLLPHAPIGMFLIHGLGAIGSKALMGGFFAVSVGFATTILILYLKHRKNNSSDGRVQIIPPEEDNTLIVIKTPSKHNNTDPKIEFPESGEISLKQATSNFGSTNLMFIINHLEDYPNKENSFKFSISPKSYHAWLSGSTVHIQNAAQIKTKMGIIEINISSEGEIKELKFNSKLQENVTKNQFEILIALCKQLEKSENIDDTQISAEDFALFIKCLSITDQKTFTVNDTEYKLVYSANSLIIKSSNYSLTIFVSPSGKILKYKENDDNEEVTNALPYKGAIIIKSLFEKALESSSSYKAYGYYDIMLVRKTLKKIPEYHLGQLAGLLLAKDKVNKNKNTKLSEVKLSVRFLDGKDESIGADAGGLSRDYLDDLFTSLMTSKEVSFDRIDQGLHYPIIKKQSDETALSENQKLIFQNIGVVLMYCYLSPNTRLSAQSNKYWIGQHFGNALFRTIQSLSAKEIASSTLEKETRFKMCLLLGASLHTNIVNFINNPTNVEFFKKAQKIALEHFNKNFNDHNELKNFLSSQLVELVEPMLLPIHFIAKGMLAYSEASEESSWDIFQKKETTEVSEVIQGFMNRKAIVNSFDISESDNDNNAEIIKKLNWLKHWILEGASEEQLKKLAKLICGSTAFPKGRKITVKSQTEEFHPFITAHTCGPSIDICPQPAQYGKYNDHTYENFINSLIAVLSQVDLYTDI